MKNRILIVIITILLSSLIISAQQFKGRNSNRACLAEKLNLTEEQQKNIEDIRYTHQNKIIDLRAELKKSRLAQHKLLNEENLDKDEYMAMENKTNELQASINTARAEMKLEILAQLDDTQKEIWLNSARNIGIRSFRDKAGRTRDSRRSGLGRMNCW